MNKTPITTIIWDWNGTLLDDVDVSIDAMNELLIEKKLPLLNKTYYRQIFRFPVQEYYADLGLCADDESFREIGLHFMDVYRSIAHQAKLFSDALETLQYLKRKYNQYILSAMEQNLLEKMTKDYGVDRFLQGVFGIDNHLGERKTEIGKQLMKTLSLQGDECLMIGDSIHDSEVAKACKFKCVLYSGGHVSVEKLKTTRNQIINKLSDLKSIL